MRIDLCFQGWLRGVEIEEVTDVNGDTHDVSHMSAEDVVKTLNNGGYFISLANAIPQAGDQEIELFDFQVSD